MGYPETDMNVRGARCSAGLLAVLLAAGGCTVKGHGKAATPAWKVTVEETPLAVPPQPLRSGAVELRIRQAFLEEHKTILETQHWKARVRGTVVSPAPLPLADLSGAFTFVGKSGKVYRAHVSTVGPGRQTWQHQQHTGKPTQLPANVPGELDIWTQIGDAQSHDEPVLLTFRDVRVPLGR